MLRLTTLLLFLAALAACRAGGRPKPAPAAAAPESSPSPASHLVVLHREIPEGSRYRVRGRVTSKWVKKGKWVGWVLTHRRNQVVVDYNVVKTLLAVDPLTGVPTRIQLDVDYLSITTGEAAPKSSLHGGRSVVLRDVLTARKPKIRKHFGVVLVKRDGRIALEGNPSALTRIEKEVLTDPLGPAWEMAGELAIASALSPEERLGVGATWDGDSKVARRILQQMGAYFPSKAVHAVGTLSEIRRSRDLEVMHVRGEIGAAGGTFDDLLPNAELLGVEAYIEYDGLYPMDIDTIAIEHRVRRTLDLAIRWRDKGDWIDVNAGLEETSQLKISAP